MDIAKKIFAFFLDILETIVVAMSIFVVVYLFFLQPHQVIGNSMYPNFLHDEFILTDKISYRMRSPERGEVIVFKSPEDQNRDFIKRIIGLPGDKVKVEGGNVYVNGKMLNEPYLDGILRTGAGKTFEEGKEITVPENSFVVFGDNRSNSSDSRAWGTIESDKIIGRALIIYWPLDKFGLVRHVEYH